MLLLPDTRGFLVRNAEGVMHGAHRPITHRRRYAAMYLTYRE